VILQLNNKLAHGQIEFDITSDGEGMWRAVGADTFNPFTPDYNKYFYERFTSGTSSGTYNVKIPDDCKRGIVLIVQYCGIYSAEISGNDGIKRKKAIFVDIGNPANEFGRSSMCLWACKFMPGGTFNLSIVSSRVEVSCDLFIIY
jgi:hypothetical protein